MPRDILIVDDEKTALRNFGNDVRLNLNLEPFLAENPDDALKILSFYPIKVLVTDQEMPNMLGTELVAKIKNDMEISLPCIMLTAHSDNVNAVEAVNLGFFRFIDKKNVTSELIPAIREAIQRYDRERASLYTSEIDETLFQKTYFPVLKNRIKISLIRVTSTIDPFVNDNDWQTKLVAERNISGSKEIHYKRRVKTELELGLNSEIVQKTGLKLGKIIGAIETNLSTKLAFSAKNKYEKELEVSAQYKIEVTEIKDEPNTEGLILQSREYQMAPVFTRVNCLLKMECSTCEIPRFFDISVDLPTNRIALRQIEHYDKGVNKTIYTGFYEGVVDLYLRSSP